MKIRKPKKQDQKTPEEMDQKILLFTQNVKEHIIAVLFFCQVTADFDITHINKPPFSNCENVFIILYDPEKVNGNELFC